jgi:hypothetical protein
MVCFQNQKSQFGKMLEGLGMERVGIFYGQLDHFTAIWSILWSFGNFFRFGICIASR